MYPLLDLLSSATDGLGASMTPEAPKARTSAFRGYAWKPLTVAFRTRYLTRGSEVVLQDADQKGGHISSRRTNGVLAEKSPQTLREPNYIEIPSCHSMHPVLVS